MKIEITEEYGNPISTMLSGELVSNTDWNNFITDNCNVYNEDYIPESVLRENYIQNIGFAIHTKETITTLANYLRDKTVVEAGSGSGYLSSQLTKLGIHITAVDKQENYSFDTIFKLDVTGDAVEYIKKHQDVTDVILSWPSLGEDFPIHILENMPSGSRIWYLGEDAEGCCAPPEFFEKLEQECLYLDIPSKNLNNHQLRFRGLHDYWKVYLKD